MTRRTLATALAALSALAGALLSALLFLRQGGVDGPFGWLAALCGTHLGAGCDLVQRSPLAEPFGVSLAWLGAGYYGLALVLLASARISGGERERTALVSLAVAGLVLDAGLLAYSLLVVGALCTLCALTYAATLGLALGAYWLAREPAPASVPLRAQLGVLAAGALALTAGLGWLAALRTPTLPSAYVAEPERALRLAWDAFLAHYRAAPVARLATDGAPRMGSARPVLELVLFADFACPHCARAAQELTAFVERHRDTCALVFKHDPLDAEYRPGEASLHPGAGELARAAVAAGEQGLFWRLAPRLFAARERWRGPAAPRALERLVRAGGREPEAFRAAVAAPATHTRVAADVAEARALGVVSTPALFVNGRRLVSLPLEPFLEELLRVEGAGRAGFATASWLARGASE
jgi:uncharacterized membrane protein/predicted DsbA family dithiol-disulfide isomerase